MIIALRIDERLIHGQVAVAWVTTLNVDSIVVANDHASTDEISKMTLRMAAPPHVKLAVKSVEESVEILKDSRLEKKRVLVLVTNPKDALTLITSLSNVPDVMVGNFGMFKSKEPRKCLGTSLYVSESELNIFKEILFVKPNSYYQMTPTLTPVLISNLIK